MKDFCVKCVATFFYLGYFPLAAGSLASAAGGFVACLLIFHPLSWFVLWGIVAALGFWASGAMEKLIGKKDPACIVIDEFAGAMIAFFMLPLTPGVFWSAFFVFRAFDMFKIYPANLLEKKSGSLGVMMDDIMAGVYTNIIMHAAIRLAAVV